MIALDAPTDKLFKKVSEIVGFDKRFKIVLHTKHLGVCGNMYRIIKDAEKDFCPKDNSIAVIVDADDYITKDAFETVVKVFRKHSEVRITHGSYMKMSRKKRTRISRPNPKKGNIRKLPWRSSHLKAIRWEVIKRVEP